MEIYKGLIINGYSWLFKDKEIHTFSKPSGKGYNVIECKTEQLTNGDIQFMTKHNISLIKKQSKQK